MVSRSCILVQKLWVARLLGCFHNSWLATTKQHRGVNLNGSLSTHTYAIQGKKRDTSGATRCSRSKFQASAMVTNRWANLKRNLLTEKLSSDQGQPTAGGRVTTLWSSTNTCTRFILKSRVIGIPLLTIFTMSPGVSVSI